MHKVVTTMQPDRVIEVGDQELTDLYRQGLIADLPEARRSNQSRSATGDDNS